MGFYGEFKHISATSSRAHKCACSKILVVDVHFFRSHLLHYIIVTVPWNLLHVITQNTLHLWYLIIMRCQQLYLKHYLQMEAALDVLEPHICWVYLHSLVLQTEFARLSFYFFFSFSFVFLISRVLWHSTIIKLSVKTRWLLAKLRKGSGKFSHEVFGK